MDIIDIRTDVLNNNKSRLGVTVIQAEERLRAEFLELMKKKRKRTLLDVGAGHGRDSSFFREHGIEAAAVDLSEEMVKLCREKSIEAYELDYFNLSRLGRQRIGGINIDSIGA